MNKIKTLILIGLVVTLFTGCDYITNSKLIIRNNSEQPVLIWLYKNGNILEQLEIENGDGTGSDILIDTSNGLQIEKYQTAMILNITEFGPKRPIEPFEYFDQIIIENKLEKRIVTKDEVLKYFDNEVKAIFYLEVVNHN